MIPDRIPFSKMSGSGNDFVVIDHRSLFIAEHGVPAFTRAVCHRRLGIGADGVILIEDSQRPDVDFRWRYFNADGSVGEMCGNGAMCGARFAVSQGIGPATCRFETEAGVVVAEVVDAAADPGVSIEMPDIVLPTDKRVIEVLGQTQPVTSLTVGVPHAVVVVADADATSEQEFDAWGRELRYHPAFLPAGTNANMIHRIDAHTLRMRTWERGVEAETLACGTGAVASALVAVQQGLVSQPVSVVVSSGRRLRVSFEGDGDMARQVRLRGEARLVAEGEISVEMFG